MALIAFLLLAPPMFVAGPLAGLLLLSRPTTRREWGWLLGATVWSLVWLQQPGGLAAQFTRAGAVLLCGTFLALTLWRPSGRFSRALTATAITGGALLVWMLHLGLTWPQVRKSVADDLTGSYRLLQTQWSAAPSARELLSQMAAMSDTVAALYPALLGLACIGGIRLAWVWNHRIARRPVGPPPTPFRAFTFSDHLVWGWVMALGLVLFRTPEPLRLVGQNLLLVWAVLYASRGLAIASAVWGPVPAPVFTVLGIIALFLLPFVLGGLTLLGLADTWLDFRRRLTTPTTGGYHV
jgi:hypothetical protein